MDLQDLTLIPVESAARRHVVIEVPDHGLRKIVASTVRREGVEVTEVYGTDQAVRETGRGLGRGVLPNAVVLDARRDPVGTIDGITRLRALAPEMPIAILVGKREPPLVEAAERLGVRMLDVPLSTLKLRKALFGVKRKPRVAQ